MKPFAVFSLALVAALVPGSSRRASAADAKELFEARVYENGDKKLNYRLMTPANYDKDQKYPLVAVSARRRRTRERQCGAARPRHERLRQG